MGASNSNCMRQSDVDKSVNGLQDTDVAPTLPPESTASRPKMDVEADCPRVEGADVLASKTTDEEPGKRRHSTPTCGIAHLSRLGTDSPGEYDGRCRRSGSAVPRRVNKPMKDDSRRAALPPWAKAVRSSRGESSAPAQRRDSGGGGATGELGHNGVRLESTTNDPAFAARRQEFPPTNYSVDERLDRVDSMGSGGRSSSGIRFESQFSSDTGSSPHCDHIPSFQAPTAGHARPPQQRRSSIAFLPVSQGSASSGMFSPRSVGPPAGTKDRINLGFGNASDLVASLIGSRGPDPTASATEDNFWVPPTIWRKKRAQSLIPQKQATDTRVISGKPHRCSLCNAVTHTTGNKKLAYTRCMLAFCCLWLLHRRKLCVKLEVKRSRSDGHIIFKVVRPFNHLTTITRK